MNEQKINDYTNLVYACTFCNRARSVAPRVTPGCRLLDPTKDAWASHFQIEEDCLVPKVDDMDASYTYEVYDLNDDRKVARRASRYKILSESIRIIEEGTPFLEELNDRAEKILSKDLIEMASVLSRAIRQARLNLEPYSAIPADAPTRCRCGTRDMHSLPEEFARQTVQI